jgi:threonylcarbamoyladenosine tRNA methylthiotransferase MtaB
MNTYESEVIKEKLENAGVEDLIIVNTCAVTSEAERQSKQAIRKLKKENPTSRLVVTGCAAQISPEKFYSMKEVDFILGNREKLYMQNMVKRLSKINDKSAVSDIMEDFELDNFQLDKFEGMSKAFVKIQEGCDNRCTYCIVPYTRGHNKSVPYQQIKKQLDKFIENGYKEIVLTGIDVASYGKEKDSVMRLGGLVKKLLKETPKLERLRIGSIDPMGVDDDLLSVIKNDERFLPHIHLSMQSGDDTILKRMARRHRQKDLIDICDKLRQASPEIAIGSDFITGFPTETDEMFENTYNFVKQAKLTHLHVFPYSIRENTPAAKMEMVDKKIRKQRAKKLRKLADELKNNYAKTFVGKNVKLLAEKEQSGHCEHYLNVELDKKVNINNIITAKINDVKGSSLLGEVINE